MTSQQKTQAISDSIEMLLSYKKGNLSLTEASTLFSQITGIDRDMAGKSLRGMSRTNVKALIKKDSKNV